MRSKTLLSPLVHAPGKKMNSKERWSPSSRESTNLISPKSDRPIYRGHSFPQENRYTTRGQQPIAIKPWMAFRAIENGSSSSCHESIHGGRWHWYCSPSIDAIRLKNRSRSILFWDSPFPSTRPMHFAHRVRLDCIRHRVRRRETRHLLSQRRSLADPTQP